MLEIFSVTPKNPHAGSTFIMDSHLSQVVGTSFRSLKVIELVKCGFIRDFVCLSRCLELTRLVISFNEYMWSNLKNQDMGMICKRCLNLQQIFLEACRRLDQNLFEHLMYVETLETLTLRSFRQSFVKLKKMGTNPNLRRLDLEGSMITDAQAFQLSQLGSLTFLSVRCCSLLTDKFIDYLLTHVPKTKLREVQLDGCGFQEQKVNLLQTVLAKTQ